MPALSSKWVPDSSRYSSGKLCMLLDRAAISQCILCRSFWKAFRITHHFLLDCFHSIQTHRPFSSHFPTISSSSFHPTVRIVTLECWPVYVIPCPTASGQCLTPSKGQKLKPLTWVPLWTVHSRDLHHCFDPLFYALILSYSLEASSYLLPPCLLHLWCPISELFSLAWLGQILCIIQNSALEISLGSVS